jgi:sodium-dependent phosphate cotransporter
MGANIGTSVTNILVSLAHINRSNEFRRSFAASTVHDFFNVLSVLVVFPIQYFTNFLGEASARLADGFQNIGGLRLFNPIKAITKPVVHLMIELIGQHPWIILIISLVLLFVALRYLVKVLRVLFVKRAEEWFNMVLFKTELRAFILGLLITALAQSSSITTSLIIPFAGAGILRLEQIFPYTLGANLGTTITAILASLITSEVHAVTVAFAHLLFNISGTIIWWPLKKVPIAISQKFSEFAIKNKAIPIIYIVLAFFALPLIIILLFR